MNDQSETSGTDDNNIEPENTYNLHDSVETGRLEDTVVLQGAHRRLRKMLLESLEGASGRAAERSIVLVVRGMTENVTLNADFTAVLGRSDHKNVTVPDVDLARFGAAERGVSREHLRIELRDDKFYIVDLNSTNGSFLYDERLEPNKPYHIQHGDEFTLARLTIQILLT